MSADSGFQAAFGRVPTVRTDAPGRVNLIGEHTDYNGGFVLPIAIPQRCRVAVAAREDGTVRAISRERGEQGVVEYKLGREAPGREWLDYLQGVTAILSADGHALRGFEIGIASDVPLGSGVSSSAAFEVSVLRALRELFGLRYDDVALARLGQRVENEFVGARVGIMDQLAASLADERAALFVDTRTLAAERVAMPDGVELVVINSGVSHSNVGGEYNTRRAECEAACAALGIRELRDIGMADLSRIDALPEPLNRRARHVVTENARVLATVDAMRAGNVEQMGRLFSESHASMRDDYAVSVDEIDLLVSLAEANPDVIGARLTGGGFGGSIVALAKAGVAGDVARWVGGEYARRSGRTPTVLVPSGA